MTSFYMLSEKKRLPSAVTLTEGSRAGDAGRVSVRAVV
jgi:hypothetical protein